MMRSMEAVNNLDDGGDASAGADESDVEGVDGARTATDDGSDDFDGAWVIVLTTVIVTAVWHA